MDQGHRTDRDAHHGLWWTGALTLAERLAAPQRPAPAADATEGPAAEGRRAPARSERDGRDDCATGAARTIPTTTAVTPVHHNPTDPTTRGPQEPDCPADAGSEGAHPARPTREPAATSSATGSTGGRVPTEGSGSATSASGRDATRVDPAETPPTATGTAPSRPGAGPSLPRSPESADLTGDFAHATGPVTDLAERRLRRWQADWSALPPEWFAGRLATAGLDTDRLTALLGESAHSLAARVPEPAWVSDVRRVLAAAPANASHPAEDWREGFAVVLAPFVQDAADRLTERVGPLAELRSCFTRQLGARLVALARRTLVLELNVRRVTGRLSGATPEERFADYVRQAAEPRALAELLMEYPVLARLLAQACTQAVTVWAELLEHWERDRADVVRDILGGKDPGALTEVRLDAGDRHQGGRGVALLRFASGARLVHKPRPLTAHRHFRAAVDWLNSRLPDAELTTPAVLDRPGYGWAEFVAAAECADTAQVDRFYRRLGALLALLHVLGATDIHCENLVAAGDRPVLVDLETLFHPSLVPPAALGADPALDALGDSVRRVALLPFLVVGERGALDPSGLGGDKDTALPAEVVDWAAPGTDRMALVRGTGMFAGSANRPRLNGVDADPGAHVAALIEGFGSAYRTIAAHRDELAAPEGLLAAFADDTIRVVARSSSRYAVLLEESTHPDVLRDALDRDRLFDLLWRESVGDPLRWHLAPEETAQLWAGDIPLFSATPAAPALTGHAGRHWRESGLDQARRRLAAMGEPDLRTQEWIIRASLATRNADRPLPARPGTDAQPETDPAPLLPRPAAESALLPAQPGSAPHVVRHETEAAASPAQPRTDPTPPSAQPEAKPAALPPHPEADPAPLPAHPEAAVHRLAEAPAQGATRAEPSRTKSAPERAARMPGGGGSPQPAAEAGEVPYPAPGSEAASGEPASGTAAPPQGDDPRQGGDPQHGPARPPHTPPDAPSAVRSRPTASGRGRPTTDAVPAAGTVTAPDPAQLLAAATRLADDLLVSAHRNGRRINWLGLERDEDGHLTVAPQGAGLGDGYTGTALFLAETAALAGTERHAEAARSAIAPVPELLGLLAEVPEHLDVVGNGAFTGLGGIAWALTRLAHVLDDKEVAGWAEQAVALAAAVPPGGEWNVASGDAGCLAAMVALHEAESTPAWTAAAACAERLAAMFVPGGRVAVEPGGTAVRRAAVGHETEPVGEFATEPGSRRAGARPAPPAAGPRTCDAAPPPHAAHTSFPAPRGPVEHEPASGPVHRPSPAASGGLLTGTAGVGWALRRFAAAGGGEGYEEYGVRLLRGCLAGLPGNAAPAELLGTALASGSGGHPDLDAHLSRTRHALDSPGSLPDHSLGHGEAAALDLLSAGPDRSGRTAARARRLLVAIGRDGPRCATPDGVATPGLLTGLAGVGHQLLRLAAPGAVPSVLRLDPPAGGRP